MKFDSFWEWVPLVSFGVFQFGTPLRNYKRLRPIYLPEESTIFYEKEKKRLNQFGYTLPRYWKTLRFHVDCQDRIVSVMSEKFFYKGHNLIHRPIGQIVDILGKNYDDKEDMEVFGEIIHTYTFDDLGLFLWMKNNLSETMTASSAYED